MTGEGSARWEQALLAVLASGLDDSDCASIHLDVSDDAARLTYTTRDGRRAERSLADPDELGPTIEALRVTVPVAGPPPAPPPASEVASEVRPKAAPPTPSGAPIFALLAGARRGGDTLFSPVLGGVASLMAQRWELALMTALEIQRFDVPNQTRAGRKSTTVALGVVVGRRVPVGRVDLLGGGRVAVAALFDQDDQRGPTELRTGGYLGAVLGPRGGIRVRAELAADLVGGSHSAAVEVADMDGQMGIGEGDAFDPRWAVTCSLGVELGGP